MKIITGRGGMRAVILGLCILFVCGNLAAAMDRVARLTEPGDRRASNATATPSAAQTMAAYKAMEPWIRAWVVPAADAIDGDLHRTLAGVSAVNVALRLNGALIGRGESVGAISGEQRNAAELLRSATAAAIEQATPKLNIPNDATRDEVLRLLTRDVTISIELAGPFTLTEPKTWGDVDGTWKPGLDGVAVNAGQATAAPELMFPSTMLAANIIPSRAMSSAAARVIGEGGAAAALEEPKALREKHGLRTYRFRVTHLAQAEPDAAPEFLHRGARLIPAGGAMRGEELDRWATQLASNLNERLQQPDAIAGTTPIDQLIAAYAIGAYAKYNVEAPRPEDETKPIRAIKERVARVTHENELKVPGAPALSVLAMKTIWWSPKARAFPTGLIAMPALWKVAFGEEVPDGIVERYDTLRRMELTKLEGLPLSMHATLVLAALQCPQLPTAAHLDKGDSVLRAVYAMTPEENQVSLLPWIGWAECELAWMRCAGLQEDYRIGGAIALRRMREQCWKHQLSLDNGATSTDDADMLGGITFAIGDGSQAPYPTWHCAKPLAFIATMLRDPRLTEPHERPREIARLMSALRYLRQLQVDESSAWMYANPGAAMGGIRASVWDNTQPVEATAYTLLCVVETLKSLDALAMEQAGGAAPQPPQSPPAQPAATLDSKPR